VVEWMRAGFSACAGLVWRVEEGMRWLRCAGVVFLGMACVQAEGPEGASDGEDEALAALRRFVEVMETVRERHPEVDRCGYERLTRHALEGMLSSLDPHSSFLHPEMKAVLEAREALDPDLRSIGLTLGWRAEGPYLAAVAPRGAAARAGLGAGARLWQVDGLDAAEMSPADLLGALRRRAGESSRLRVQAAEEPQPREVVLIHRRIADGALAEHRVLEALPGTGYLRLESFPAGCARQVERAMDELEALQEIRAWVLDLRGNGGGDLGETVRLLGLFLPAETKVVETRGRGEEAAETLRTPARRGEPREQPLAVLIDERSASASELTAGALQDLARAVVVGETSYGKGSVQNIIPFGDGTALRLTVATYHTPSGRTPHRQGITPDVAVAWEEADRRNFDDFCQLDSLPPARRQEVEAWRDPVLAAALEALRARRAE
jgi:carboxyl-terminal processing protease